MADIESIHKPKLLVVEGKDEKYFFESFLTYLRLGDIKVMDIGGKSGIPSKLKALTNLPNFNNVISIGVIRDADDNPVGAFQSIRNAMKRVRLHVPNSQISFTRGKPRTGIMIMPSPGVSGMLEDICLKSIKDTAEMECITEFLDCIKRKTKTLPRNLSKARIQSFLAIKEPGLRLGEAAQKGIWKWDNRAFKEIKRFLRLL